VQHVGNKTQVLICPAASNGRRDTVYPTRLCNAGQGIFPGWAGRDIDALKVVLSKKW